MTEEQLANAAKLMSESYDRMAQSRERFADTIIGLGEMMTNLIESIRSFEDRLDSRLKVQDARVEFLKTIQDSLTALVPALSDAGVSWNENNDRLDKLTTLLETHFGSDAGLRYDN